jgi:hypothetical protein
MDRMRSSEQIGAVPADWKLKGTVSTKTYYFTDFERLVFLMLDLFRFYNRVVIEHIDCKMDEIEFWP